MLDDRLRNLSGPLLTNSYDCSLPVRRNELTPAVQRQRLLDGGLVGVAEVAEGGERLLQVLSLAQCEGIEAAAGEVEQLVAEHVADRAQLALPAVALTQQPPGRIPAAVSELREIDRNDAEQLQVLGDRGRLLVAVQPDPEPAGARRQLLAPLLPQIGRASCRERVLYTV